MNVEENASSSGWIAAGGRTFWRPLSADTDDKGGRPWTTSVAQRAQLIITALHGAHCSYAKCKTKRERERERENHNYSIRRIILKTPPLASEMQIAIHQRITTEITNARAKKHGVHKSNRTQRIHTLWQSVNFIGTKFSDKLRTCNQWHTSRISPEEDTL